MKAFRDLILFCALPALRAQDGTHLKVFSMQPGNAGHYSMDLTAIDAEGISLRNLLAFSYGVPGAQVLGPDWLDDRYRVVAKAEEGEEIRFKDALREAVSAKLHLRETRSTKQIPVFVLRSAAPELAKKHASTGPLNISGSDHTMSAKNVPFARFVKILSDRFSLPMIDETELHAEYTVELEWTAGDVNSLAREFRKQLGVEWTEERRDVPVILVNLQ